MWYRKNISMLERIARGLGGGAMIAAGSIYWSNPVGWLLVASGVGLIGTGWLGYCPACAMVGRRYLE